jgi:hypothetical protein
MRPVSRRAFKKGGKVVANEGKDAVKHAGKKPRSGSKHLTIDALINRNYKDANEDREGIKHIGGLKTGGRAGKAGGGEMVYRERRSVPKSISDMYDREDSAREANLRTPQGAAERKARNAAMMKAMRERESGDRTERASGGSTYGVSTPLRLMKTHKGPNGHTAKVYKDQDWGEYRVKHYDPEGKHLPKADYHTDDREEAHDFAASAVDKGFKRGGSKKAGGGPLSQMDGDLYGLKNNPNPNRSTMMKKGGSAKKAGGGANYPIRVPIRDADAGLPAYVSDMGVGPYLREAKAAAAKAAAAQRNRAEAAAVAAGNREPMEMMPPRQTPGMIQRKKGGKVPVRQWENSAKDKAQDKKLAKKHHETFEEWEGSAADRKHDKQQSMKGLKRGGMTSLDGEMQTQEKVGGRIAKRDGGGLANLEMASGGRAKRADGGTNKLLRDAKRVAEKLPYQTGYEKGTALAGRSDESYRKRRGEDLSLAKMMREEAPERIREDAVKAAQKDMANLRAARSAMKDEGYNKGGRTARKSGGRAKGKTNINIIIGTGQKQPMGLAPGMPQPPGIPVPVPPPGAGGPPPPGMPPMGMPPGMPPAGGPPPMPMPMPPAGGPPPMGRKRGGRTGHYDYGAGGGKGRLEKIDEYGEKQKK